MQIIGQGPGAHDGHAQVQLSEFCKLASFSAIRVEDHVGMMILQQKVRLWAVAPWHA